jgi:phosphoserine phosphatase
MRTALVYDFDGTLAAGNIQESSLLPNLLGINDPGAFWEEAEEMARNENADSISMYLKLIIDKARKQGKPITKEVLHQHGKDIDRKLFSGVSTWFDRINEYASQRGLTLEHYIVSSANEEMIRGSSIADKFKEIFACKYFYDADGYAVWPSVAINYTTKTQYLFRINKDVLNHHDNKSVNRWSPLDERPIPFCRMIYLGDGDTDIPSMKMVRHQGGYSVAVFDPEKWPKERTQRKVYQLIAEDRAHFVVPADYSDGSQLDVTIKGVLGRIARDCAGYRKDN